MAQKNKACRLSFLWLSLLGCSILWTGCACEEFGSSDFPGDSSTVNYVQSSRQYGPQAPANRSAYGTTPNPNERASGTATQQSGKKKKKHSEQDMLLRDY